MDVALIEFRPAVLHDAAHIAAVHDEAWRATYQGIIPHLHLERMIGRRGPLWWKRQITRGAEILLLVFDGVPRGYATIGRARGSWPWPAGEIYELYLSPIYQGVGLGTQLFLQARKTLADHGLDKLVVWALKDNEMACAFYKNAGGVVAASAQEKYGTASLTRLAFVWGAGV